MLREVQIMKVFKWPVKQTFPAVTMDPDNLLVVINIFIEISCSLVGLSVASNKRCLSREVLSYHHVELQPELL